MTGTRCASDHRSAGSIARVRFAHHAVLVLGNLPPRNNATAAGTNVSDSTIALVRASTTVIAIGWNIFPSMPVSAKIGQIHRGDDADAEQARPDDFGRRARRELEAFFALEDAPEPALAPRRSVAARSRR